MKILFTADIHIKLGQKNVPVDWALNRYKLLEDSLHNLQAAADLFIIGGDIFDKLPNMEELEVYFSLISACRIKTIIYSGNHEALKKNTTFLSYLKVVTNKINPLVEIIDDFYTLDNIDFIPYNKLKEYHPADIDFHGDILCTHVRGEIPPHVKPEVDLSMFDRWKVVLAGDLHSHENTQRNILYPGSPITTSFHRNKVKTGVVLLDSETFKYDWIELDLPQLIRKTIKAGEEMIPGDSDWIIYEVEGDLAELGTIQDNNLIDKKVVKREVDTALILDPELSLEEEVSEYLKYILQLPDKTVEAVLKEFNNHSDKL